MNQQPTESERNETLRAARARLAWGCPVAQIAADLQLTQDQVAELEERDDRRAVVRE
jgi:hypothetical protein